MASEEPKKGTSKNGQPMHYSVGAVIERDGKYLLIDRRYEPLGFAGLAGHIDEGEDDPAKAMAREVSEESGLKVEKYRLLFDEEVSGNSCHRGIDIHYWYLYYCEASGEAVWNKEEEKSMGWYAAEQIKEMQKNGKLEPVWEHWFKKLGVI